jgi:hypothetical protein
MSWHLKKKYIVGITATITAVANLIMITLGFLSPAVIAGINGVLTTLSGFWLGLATPTPNNADKPSMLGDNKDVLETNTDSNGGSISSSEEN